MIRFRRYGTSGAHRPLLATPGIDGSPGSIAPIVEQLARRRLVAVADYSAEQNPTLELLTDEIARGVREELPGPLDVLGQSIGTIIAAQLADRQHLPIRKVVLIGTFTKLHWRLLQVSNLAVKLVPPQLYRLSVAPLMALVCGPVGDGRRHPFFQASRDSDPVATVRRTTWEIHRDFGVDLAQLAQLKRPTLILMGAQDRFVPHLPSEVRRLRALFAGTPASVVVVPGAGHVLLPSAAIQWAVSEIEAFLACDGR